MTIQDFVAAFAAQFDETDPSEFTPQTEFRNLEEWTSLTALSIIGMADECSSKAMISAMPKPSKTCTIS